MSEWTRNTVLILPKSASRILCQFSKEIVSAWPARAPDRSPSKHSKDMLTPTATLPSQHQNADPHAPISQWQVATCTIIHWLNFQREMLFFSQCLGEIPCKLFCYLLSIPSLKTSQLVMAIESLTRAQGCRCAEPFHATLPSATPSSAPTCQHLSHTWAGSSRVQRLLFLTCCLHSA